MESMNWPELPCGCGTAPRCSDCGVCVDCYGCECERPTIDANLSYITDPVRAVGRARNAPASKARIRRPANSRRIGPPPHVGPPPVEIAPTEPVSPPQWWELEPRTVRDKDYDE